LLPAPESDSDFRLAPGSFTKIIGCTAAIFLLPAPESDSDFRLAPGSFTKLENLIFNHHTRRVDARRVLHF
jgi:hypothetical protein